MKIKPTSIPDVLTLEPIVHGDERGYFMETFRTSDLQKSGINGDFVQDNQSKSKKGTLRGLHYEVNFPQGKLVRVIHGEIFDVAVDLRKSSSTFGCWVGELLSSKNKKQLWVPAGFAHGFYVLSEEAEVFYRCTNYYHPEHDRNLLWNDEKLAIEWPLIDPSPILSSKDKHGTPFSKAEFFQ